MMAVGDQIDIDDPVVVDTIREQVRQNIISVGSSRNVEGAQAARGKTE